MKHTIFLKQSIKYSWRQFYWICNLTNIMNNLTVVNVQSKYRFSMSAMSHWVWIIEQNGTSGGIKFNWPKNGFLIFVTVTNNPNYYFYMLFTIHLAWTDDHNTENTHLNFFQVLAIWKFNRNTNLFLLK